MGFLYNDFGHRQLIVCALVLGYMLYVFIILNKAEQIKIIFYMIKSQCLPF